MKIGKVPPSVLKEFVFGTIGNQRNEIILGPEIGEDCSAIQLKEDEVFLISTDPITGAENNAGYLSVHVSCNDIASSGGEPIGILLTILLPETSTKEDLHRIMKDARRAADEINIDIIGGHTEISDAVNRPIISAAVVGKVQKDRLISTKNASIGQDIIMTKWAGLEGTAILSKDFEQELLKSFSKEFLTNAQEFNKYLSVVSEGKIGAEFGASSMHDATEGGVLGAVWEIIESSNVGAEVYLDKIPIKKETKAICNHFNISPYRLISSGCMIMTSFEGPKLTKQLRDHNIEAQIIGKIVEQDRTCIDNGMKTPLEEPDVDELYKIII